MGALEDATGLHQQLMAAWKSANADQCRDLLKKLKVCRSGERRQNARAVRSVRGLTGAL